MQVFLADYPSTHRLLSKPPSYRISCNRNPRFHLPSLWLCWTGHNAEPSSRSCTHGSFVLNIESKATARANSRSSAKRTASVVRLHCTRYCHLSPHRGPSPQVAEIEISPDDTNEDNASALRSSAERMIWEGTTVICCCTPLSTAI